MQKNWYILYTRAGREKKVAALLTKRKIENFYPLNCVAAEFPRKNKMVHIPLFASYVFVNTTVIELERLKQIGQVLSLVYWKGQPATISENEINCIKHFSKNHRFIKVMRSKIVENEKLTINSPSYSFEGNVLSIQNKMIKVKLPSLGFTVTAQTETESVICCEISFGKRMSHARKYLQATHKNAWN